MTLPIMEFINYYRQGGSAEEIGEIPGKILKS